MVATLTPQLRPLISKNFYLHSLQINGGGGVDKFRIKIWDKNNGDAIVYDNQMGMDDNGTPSTALAGGSITIHSN